MFNRKFQRQISIVIAILVSISLISTGVVVFYPTSQIPQAQSSVSSADAAYNYENLKKVVAGLSANVEKDSSNTETRLDLANAYYDLGNLARENEPTEVAGYFKKAVENYQEVLKQKQDDINILVDIATASFYAGENELAETSFKQALAQNPTFFNALLNYGVFLYNAKGDIMGAITQWNKALESNPQGPNADLLKGMIDQAQQELINSANNNSSTEGKSSEESSSSK